MFWRGSATTGDRDALGRAGEDLVAHRLSDRGFKISGRRVRTPFGEIDLIAESSEVVVFVEVKTRRSKAFGAPAEAVGWKKSQSLVRSVESLRASRPRLRDRPCRIDVVEVLWAVDKEPVVTFLEGAVDGFGTS